MFSPTRLLEVRVRQGFSRSRLHEELILHGVRRCRALINLWESGHSEPHATELEALGQILGVPLEDFFAPDSDSRQTP